MTIQFKKYIKKLTPNTILDLYHRSRDYITQARLVKKYKISIGRNVYISPSCIFEKGVKLYDNIQLSSVSVGKYTYFSSNSIITNTQIGRYCSIGPNVRIGLGIHPAKKIVTTHPAFYSTNHQLPVVYADKDYFKKREKIYIGNDVWIGANVVIKDGVHIGDGAIIGAGAVVVKDVEPYSIVGGVPAKIIRYRFSQKEIDFLKQFKWWNKPEEWLQKQWKEFLDIQIFIQNNKI